MDRCKFCKSAISATLNNGSERFNVDCPVCGYYQISETAVEDDLPNGSDEDKILFSGYLRNFSTRRAPVLILSDTDIASKVLPYKLLTVPDRINKILIFFGQETKSLNQSIVLNLKRYTEFYCRTEDELMGILNHLLEEGYIRGNESQGTFQGLITVWGLKKFEELREINVQSKRAFVAMSFDEELNDIYTNAIDPACNACDFRAYRVDWDQHTGKICDKIIAEIKVSRFMIADFTHQRHNVYFEAGYALGLGIKVIWCCKKGDIRKLKFDIRQYNHIAWTSADDFKEQLINRIKAVI